MSQDILVEIATSLADEEQGIGILTFLEAMSLLRAELPRRFWEAMEQAREDGSAAQMTASNPHQHAGDFRFATAPAFQ
eukprot:3621764-Amphidinium_carterae.1